MSPRLLNEERELALIEECLATCRKVISGGMGIVEASRILSSAGHLLGLESDSTFLAITGVDSESDHFPIGRVRNEWAVEALAREDALRDAFEASVRGYFLKDCEKIIRMLDRGAA
tara:strand:+ start:364 stop:711 length:348 start_codon:yes stop_codon:yes gene_type:complete